MNELHCFIIDLFLVGYFIFRFKITLSFNCIILVASTELSTGRMDPRVGSGRVGSGRVGSRFCRILAGRVGSALRIFKFFTDYFLVPESI